MARTSDLRAARRQLLIQAAAVVIHSAAAATAIYASTLLDRTDYHTSALTGEAWVQELLHGHPERMKTELGMRVPVFKALVAALRASGQGDGRRITIEEQVAIFLYAAVTGLSIRHIGERFQRANGTISR